MSPQSTLSKEVQARLNAGESKSTIFDALKSRFKPASVERSLAQWPLPQIKKQSRQLNIPLLIIAVFFTLLTVLNVAPVFNQLAAAQMASVAVILIIQVYTIYGIFNGNLIGYMLIILMSTRNILIIVQGGISDPKLGMVLAMSAAAILLAVIQKRKLFPKTSWLMRHKRDSSGNPIF